MVYQISYGLYVGIFFISLLRCHLIYIFNFQNSIRAHVRYIDFATFQIELYRVVDYDSKVVLPNFIRIVCWKFLIYLLRTSFDNFINFLNSIRDHVRYIAFETLQIELYRVVDYDSKWSTKFHKDCMLEIFNSLLRSIL